jgi:hypothetical protein
MEIKGEPEMEDCHWEFQRRRSALLAEMPRENVKKMNVQRRDSDVLRESATINWVLLTGDTSSSAEFSSV